MDNHDHTNYVEVIHHVVVHEQQPKKTSNSFGNAGFTLSLLSILLFAIKILKYLVNFL